MKLKCLKNKTMTLIAFVIILFTVAEKNSPASNVLELSIGPSVPIIEVDKDEDILKGIGIVSYKHIFGKLLLSVNIGSFIEPMTLITTIGSGIQLQHFTLEASIGRLFQTNKSLGTHLQFLLALTYQFPKTPVFIGIFHVSNGNDFFNTGLPNHGEDYINVGYRYRF